MNENNSGYSLDYNFSYKGYSENYFSYDIPFDVFCNAIRNFFDIQSINLDGTDTSVWNAMVELDALDEIFSSQEEWLKEQCKNDAYEEFKIYVNDYILDDLEDGDDLSWK